MSSRKKQVVFFHPDLGIGGAERLVVDAAVGLQDLGYKVTIFTSYCNKSHCFDEAKDGTLDVRVRGDSIIPPKILGRFSILCAILRQLHLIFQISFLTQELQDLSPNVFFLDQLSIGVPVLRLRFPAVRLFFYCHFPDKLLAQRSSLLKRFYRVPFDFLEEWSTGASDVIAVNSSFTKSTFSKAFPHLSSRDPAVVYPCVETGQNGITESVKLGTKQSLWNDKTLFLSINRYERKKGIELAIRSYAQLDPASRKSARLVIAGGYDRRVAENVEYHRELEKLAESLGLNYATLENVITAMSAPSDVEVIFLLSIPSTVKEMLLHSATLLLYTPAFEHFGIVPLEAMLAETPVLAADVGGPTETVVDEQTGWLRSVGDDKQWTKVLQRVMDPKEKENLKSMGLKGRKRVIEQFSKAKMAQRLHDEFTEMLDSKSRPTTLNIQIMSAFVVLSACVGAIIGWLLYSLSVRK